MHWTNDRDEMSDISFVSLVGWILLLYLFIRKFNNISSLSVIIIRILSVPFSLFFFLVLACYVHSISLQLKQQYNKSVCWRWCEKSLSALLALFFANTHRNAPVCNGINESDDNQTKLIHSRRNRIDSD